MLDEVRWIQHNRTPDNSMIRLFATGLLALITCATMWGQVVSITGEVRDAKANEPILGATVLVVGSQVGTVTDVDGRFILNIPEGKCNLQISLIGYKSQTVDVCDKQDIVIILEEDTLLLDGVVVSIRLWMMRELQITRKAILRSTTPSRPLHLINMVICG